MNITSIRGFNDVLAEESALWSHIEREAAGVFGAYGFGEIRLPVVEKTELFLRSIGETTDIVEKQMYTFSDRKGESLTLRPEGTAPAVRAYIEHNLCQSPVTRLFYTGPMFRYERPQKGRYRQFYQIGAEVFGESSPGVDAEGLEMLSVLFERLGVKDVRFEINSLGCPACRPAYKEELKKFLADKKNGLCVNCKRRVDENPLRALDCKTPGCIELTREAPGVAGFLCEGCSAHFEGVKSALGNSGVPANVNPRMVRGLDYYTRTTFEAIGGDAGGGGGLGSQNAVAAGGRYDGLVEELGGPATPCFGFAIGLERLSLFVDRSKAPARPLSVFIPMGEKARESSHRLLAGIREAGLPAVSDYGEGPLKGRMKRANRLGARYVIILGEDELEKGVVTVKDMATGEQQTTGAEKLPSLLKGKT